jgi:sortase A
LSDALAVESDPPSPGEPSAQTGEATGPPRQGAAQTNGYLLDDGMKQLLRKLVDEDSPKTASGQKSSVDWDAVWAAGDNAPSEELALGSVALAAEEAVAAKKLAAPSALLARQRARGARVSRPRRPVVRPHTSLADLPTRIRRAVIGATWLRNLGVIIVLFAAWQLWGTGIAESRTQNQLRSQYQQLVKRDAAEASSLAVAARTRAKPAAVKTTVFTEGALPGGVLGRIRIPAIGVSDYFVEGVGEPQLQEGPGRYPGSGLPGQKGNLAIAGHRTTYGAPFFQLGNVRVGDRVIIDVPEGRAIYEVAHAPFAVSPDDVNILGNFGDARLTLTTCNPPFFATTRLIVVAKLATWSPTGSRVPVPLPAASALRAARASRAGENPGENGGDDAATVGAGSAKVTGDRVTGARGSAVNGPAAKGTALEGTTPARSALDQGLADEGGGWHLARLPVVLLIIGALCALGAIYDRVAVMYAGAWRWLVIAPMWAAGLLALFRVLGLLLPADL